MQTRLWLRQLSPTTLRDRNLWHIFQQPCSRTEHHLELWHLQPCALLGTGAVIIPYDIVVASHSRWVIHRSKFGADRTGSTFKGRRCREWLLQFTQHHVVVR